MTDMQKLTALLTEWGVGFQESWSADDYQLVSCETGMTKVTGYGGFVTIFKFSDDGEFIEMGAWE